MFIKYFHCALFDHGHDFLCGMKVCPNRKLCEYGKACLGLLEHKLHARYGQKRECCYQSCNGIGYYALAVIQCPVDYLYVEVFQAVEVAVAPVHDGIKKREVPSVAPVQCGDIARCHHRDQRKGDQKRT